MESLPKSFEDEPESLRSPSSEESDMSVSRTTSNMGKSRSTGPRTTRGKRRSSKNAIKHGFFSRELIQLHLRKEDKKHYMNVLRGLFKAWQPIGQSEVIQVELMAFHLQQQKRLVRLMSALRSGKPGFLLGDGFTSSDTEPEVADRWLRDLPPLEDLDKFQRYENHVLRNYYRAQAFGR